MIGRLQGILVEKQAPSLIIDVQGVGYEVNAPMSTFYHLPELGEKVSLHIHMVVREDAQLLYGFYTERERALFRSLIKVNGVGPKLALTILSGLDPDSFVQCIQNNDSSRLTGIPGIGKKTAERLIIETRDALSKWDVQANTQVDGLAPSNTQQDAISALTTLGYKNNDAKRAVEKIYNAELRSEELIRLALQSMAKGVA